MSVLAIIETNITDPSWIEEYTREVTPLVIAAGGQYLTRTSNIALLEGQDKPQFSVVAQFPSREIALGFYHSPAYQPYKNARLAGSTSKFLLVDIENNAS